MQFRLLTLEEKEKYAPEIKNDSNKILFFDGEKYWILKPREEDITQQRFDLLGYLLGKEFANVAEVRILNETELSELKHLEQSLSKRTTSNSHLVRICGSYSSEELPSKTKERAVATELIFSTWIRRRDAHTDNRVYIDAGIPMFYDHHVAFLGEDPNSCNIDYFFKDRPDHGHGSANWWRVIETSDVITTLQSRGVSNPRERAYHYVNSLALFLNELERSKLHLKEIFSKVDMEKIISSAGFENEYATGLSSFLKSGLENLDHDVEKMKQIIFLPV